MGHWEQIGVENRNALAVPMWRKIAFGTVVGVASVLIYVALAMKLWALL